jgi:hypothetical protein
VPAAIAIEITIDRSRRPKRRPGHQIPKASYRVCQKPPPHKSRSCGCPADAAFSLLKIIATIADGRWREVSRHRAAIQASIESARPRLTACIRLMFQAIVTGLHSPGTLVRFI